MSRGLDYLSFEVDVTSFFPGFKWQLHAGSNAIPQHDRMQTSIHTVKITIPYDVLTRILRSSLGFSASHEASSTCQHLTRKDCYFLIVRAIKRYFTNPIELVVVVQLFTQPWSVVVYKDVGARIPAYMI